MLKAGRKHCRYKAPGENRSTRWSVLVAMTSGVDNAPKLAVRSQWGKILKQPPALTYKHTIEGYNLMPARGLCNICNDEHLRITVDYMLEMVTTQVQD